MATRAPAARRSEAMAACHVATVPWPALVVALSAEDKIPTWSTRTYAPHETYHIQTIDAEDIQTLRCKILPPWKGANTFL